MGYDSHDGPKFRILCSKKYAGLKKIRYRRQIPCNSALLAQETLFLTQQGTFLPKDLQKVRKLRQIVFRDKIAYVRA